MSIERLGGAYIPVCDCCGEELATEWMTYCPDCYNEIHGAAADFTGVGR